MMPVLIQGPRQPDNDIDVYLRPLVEELLLLWNRTGVRVWNEHKQEHFLGRTRDLGRNISWEHGFPNDRDTYRSRQRRKDEEAAQISRLEEYVRESREALLQAQEREKDMQARMQDEIIKQVQIAMSAQRQASDPGININISPLIS